MRFGVLGPLVVGDHGTSLPLGAPQDRTVLAVLLVHANDLVGVDQLVDELWPHRPPAQARALVRGHVSRIRRTLRAGEAGRAAAERIITRKPGYFLKVHDEELDLHVFEKLVADAREDERTRRVEHRLATLRRAHRLWRGAPFADVPPSHSIAATVGRLTELRLTTLEEMYDASLACGEDAEIVAELTELVDRHPFREHLAAQLILALHRSGRTADAITLYQEVRRRLSDELGVDPGDQLQRLHLGILRNDPSLDRPAPPPWSKLDPAPRTAPHGPAGSARSGLTPRQLPAASPVFTGRAGELTELTGLPDAGTVVIGSIDGMAGIGKTALAVQAAQRLAAHYPDGQLFLDLHGFTPGVAPLDPAGALERMLRALGVPGEWIPAHLEDRSAMLRSTLAGRRVLLLLDNAADDVQVRPLLPGTPGCLTLITSRHRLAGLDDAHLMSVGVLSLSEAADLFARAVRRDDLTARSPLVSEIVDMCGRLPLAIRIAAARLRAHPAWTAEQLIERLGDHDRRLAELHAGQRSMGAALDMSYRHLTARHRRAYRLLGLHPGAAFGTDAAAALTGMPRERAEEALDDLLEAQLLNETAPGRYTFHDLVRLHAMRIAREEEREPDRQDALARLLDHYTRTASLAVDVLYAPRTPQRRDAAPAVGSAPRPATPPQAAAWLDAELANLLAAAEHAADHDAPGHVLGLSRTLQLHLHTRGHFSHAETLHERARDAALQTGDRAGEMWATIGLADAYQATIRLAAATEGHERALALAREIGDRGGELAALRGLGRSRYLAGRNRPATDILGQALRLAGEIGDRRGELQVLCTLGLLHYQTGRHEETTRCFSRGLRIAREIGDRGGELQALCGLGHAHRVRAEYDGAIDRYEQALDIADEIGHRSGEVQALCGLGHTYRFREQFDRATGYYERALDLAGDIGVRSYEFEALYGLGNTCLATGRSGQALNLHERALEMTRNLHQQGQQARAHDGLARAHHALGDRDRACHHWERALTILHDLGLAYEGEVKAADVHASLIALGCRGKGG
ncbi:AfsR/SARP family transcriptional regulator [Actinomadura madurae]|uniref:DNA-binding transcriptional activator of the SARP family n=2 Tax=Actinomadura madurae TaxID=1993 RepID=A0A1I5L5E5_9ACTN|nr:BTAD domain-containing putative transcriptional regulator [Actinomadura madurae]SFO92540.1 DNA-binding transcriptional activator of the SARP family [Actinomadura madurae]SPT49412.1 Regulatory protein AfsR [Actinomadura madurae]